MSGVVKNALSAALQEFPRAIEIEEIATTIEPALIIFMNEPTPKRTGQIPTQYTESWVIVGTRYHKPADIIVLYSSELN